MEQVTPLWLENWQRETAVDSLCAAKAVFCSLFTITTITSTR
jgi:hypothetical protein